MRPWTKVWGSVQRGKKTTRIEIGTTLPNGLEVWRWERVSNRDLERHPGLFQFICDNQVKDIDVQVAARAQ